MNTEALFLLPLGIAVGMLGALMGLGGGIIVVPVFMLGLSYSVTETVGTAMAIVFLNALSGAWAYSRQGTMLKKIALSFGMATVPGAVLGSYVSEYFSGELFQALFGVVLLLTAVNMLFKLKTAEAAAPYEASAGHIRLGMAFSLAVGFVSSVLGIGGGILHVPFMQQVLKMPIHTAIATSTGTLAISSLVGLLAHGAMGHVLWTEAVLTGIGALLGAQLGALGAQRLSAKRLTAAFAIFVFCMGIKIVYAAI